MDLQGRRIRPQNFKAPVLNASLVLQMLSAGNRMPIDARIGVRIPIEEVFGQDEKTSNFGVV